MICDYLLAVGLGLSSLLILLWQENVPYGLSGNSFALLHLATPQL